MAKQKNNISIRTNMPVILSFVIIGVVVLELAAAYVFWYGNLRAETTQVGGDSIVRVDLPGYRSVIQFLDSLVVFEPNNQAKDLGNPFLYR